MSTIELDRTTARRIAITAQQLTAARPTELEPLVNRLTLLQIDPTAAIAPAADLVAWSRLGSAYQTEHLRTALETDRTLFELDAMIRPMTDLPLFLAFMRDTPLYPRQQSWLAANASFRDDVLERLAAEGPLPSRSIPDTSRVPWESTGWSNDRNTTQLLEFLVRVGDVAISHRVGRERHFDLAERIYPNGDPLPLDEA
ncbi:MAG TPA: crosslink repair DNA glycosylase YcaQ family protein, partial [Terrimesophilobacter sp.]|nr:crosslink repair DNA glycosylase YcaQ family protein [Terrimesophilobacter sp.]